MRILRWLGVWALMFFVYLAVYGILVVVLIATGQTTVSIKR